MSNADGLFGPSGTNEYAAPTGLGDFFVIGFYKDFAPTGAVVVPRLALLHVEAA